MSSHQAALQVSVPIKISASVSEEQLTRRTVTNAIMLKSNLILVFTAGLLYMTLGEMKSQGQGCIQPIHQQLVIHPCLELIQRNAISSLRALYQYLALSSSYRATHILSTTQQSPRNGSEVC